MTKALIQTGDRITMHTKVNIEPLGSHCALCGKKSNATLWFPMDWDGSISTNAKWSERFQDIIFGWFPVGSDCAKRFQPGIVVAS